MTKFITLADEVRQFLHEYAFPLKKGLGQNFLIDAAVLEQIVTAAQITPTDHVVEIGPGIGILTRELLKQAGQVTAIELDHSVIPLLRAFLGEANHLTIVEGNALQVSYPETPYKIVANIPYHITSPLLRRVFVESLRPPQSLTLLLQREVAEKICASKDAGLLTIIVGLFGTPRLVTAVPASAFLPPPDGAEMRTRVPCFSLSIRIEYLLSFIFYSNP